MGDLLVRSVAEMVCFTGRYEAGSDAIMIALKRVSDIDDPICIRFSLCYVWP